MHKQLRPLPVPREAHPKNHHQSTKKNLPISIYGTGENIRDWIYVMDHCEAVDLTLRKGRSGETYNISSGNELSTKTLAKKILDALKQIKPSWRGELEITDTIQTLLSEEAKVQVQKVRGWWKDTGRPEDLLEENQLVLHDLEPYNHGTVEDTATITNNVAIGSGTTIHSRTTIRGPAIIGDHCDIGPNTIIGPYTSIRDHATILNGEIENSIIMEGTNIDCGRRIVDGLIGRKVRILGYEKNVPKGHKLILGDIATVAL